MQTLKHARPPVPAAAFRLVVVEGPSSGKSFLVDASLESRPLVGTSPACPIRLVDPHVSRRHLALELVGDRLRVQELGSTNGTTVNGVAVVEVLLAGGELLRLGETTIRVEHAGMTEPVVSEATTFGRLQGVSVEMRKVFGLCERLARSNVPVVIEGETGVGKELLAESLHQSGPFVVFDGSLIPEGTVERALPTLFEQADGGTLLIDEPAELELEVQRKLLRAVERGEIQPVGSDRARKVNVRVLATSRADLDKAIDEGRLREDLYFRLAVARVEIPPLRRRREDIALLAEHFWSTLGGAATPLLARFEAYAWPGNVRELQNAVARHLVTGELVGGMRRTKEDPAASPQADEVFDLPMPQARQRIIADFERAYVERILAKHGGNVSRAASASGLAHRYFQTLKAKYGR
jgi:DNA-binding NtrC family response regulator